MLDERKMFDDECVAFSGSHSALAYSRILDTLWISTVIIGGFSFVGSWSIGLFYVPAALTMLLAACENRPTFRGKVAALA